MNINNIGNILFENNQKVLNQRYDNTDPHGYYNAYSGITTGINGSNFTSKLSNSTNGEVADFYNRHPHHMRNTQAVLGGLSSIPAGALVGYNYPHLFQSNGDKYKHDIYITKDGVFSSTTRVAGDPYEYDQTASSLIGAGLGATLGATAGAITGHISDRTVKDNLTRKGIPTNSLGSRKLY